jgi:hypothetical protein
MQQWQTYLVEHYRPGTSADNLRRTVGEVRSAAAGMTRDGRALRYVRSTIVPCDEAFLATFEATSEGLVRETYASAGIPFDRITRVIQLDER